MLQQSLRRFTQTAYRSAELAVKVDMANAYGIQLAKAQTHVNGFVGGKPWSLLMHFTGLRVDIGLQRLATLLSSVSTAFPKKPPAKSTARQNSRIPEEV